MALLLRVLAVVLLCILVSGALFGQDQAVEPVHQNICCNEWNLNDSLNYCGWTDDGAKMVGAFCSYECNLITVLSTSFLFAIDTIQQAPNIGVVSYPPSPPCAQVRLAGYYANGIFNDVLVLLCESDSVLHFASVPLGSCGQIGLLPAEIVLPPLPAGDAWQFLEVDGQSDIVYTVSRTFVAVADLGQGFSPSKAQTFYAQSRQASVPVYPNSSLINAGLTWPGDGYEDYPQVLFGLFSTPNVTLGGAITWLYMETAGKLLQAIPGAFYLLSPPVFFQEGYEKPWIFWAQMNGTGQALFTMLDVTSGSLQEIPVSLVSPTSQLTTIGIVCDDPTYSMGLITSVDPANSTVGFTAYYFNLDPNNPQVGSFFVKGFALMTGPQVTLTAPNVCGFVYFVTTNVATNSLVVLNYAFFGYGCPAGQLSYCFQQQAEDARWLPGLALSRGSWSLDWSGLMAGSAT